MNGLTGARTQMSSIITSIIMILSIFFLLPYLYFLPKVSIFVPWLVSPESDQAVLAAVITLVVYASTFDVVAKGVRLISRSPCRGAARVPLLLANASMDRLPSNDRDLLLDPVLLDRGMCDSLTAAVNQRQPNEHLDWPCRKRRLLPHPGRAKVHTNTYQDHRSIT